MNNETTAARCLSLVERHAARLMREGGGTLQQEQHHRSHAPRMSAEVRERALEMILGGKLGGTEIAAVLQVVPRQIFKLAAKHAVKLPDKRHEKKDNNDDRTV
jgi:hypothetical protein